MPLSSFIPTRTRLAAVMRVALPLIVSHSALTVMQFCDRIFLARHSSVSIQAALPAGILAFAFVCLFSSTAGYAATFVAQSFGAGDRRQCVHATAQGIWLALAGLPILLLLAPVGFRLLETIGHAPEVLAEEKIYFGWLVRGGFLLSLNAVIGGYFTGQSRMRLNTVANIIGAVVNVGLDYVLIFGKLGFPEMGIRGGAMATVIASAIAPLIQFIWLLSEPEIRRMPVREVWRPDPALLRRIIRYGVPSGLYTLADITAFTAFVMLTGKMDAISLATSNIALSINWLVVFPLMAIGGAAAILAGQHQGRRDATAAARSGWDAFFVAFVYMAVMAFVFVLGSKPLFRLFYTPNPDFTLSQIQTAGFHMMVAMAIWGLFDTANVVFMGALRGVGDTRFAMLYMLAMGWGIWIPGELVILVSGGTILHAWYWMTFYVAVLSLGFIWRWRSGRWKGIRI